MNSIAKKIREARKTKGLTQEELAEQSQINLRTIQRIENNENAPRGKTLVLICDALKIDVKEIVTDLNSRKENSIGTKIINGLFLLVLNILLMSIIGFLTIDVNANLNSVFGGFMLSIFLPLFIVFMTSNMDGIERMLKYGFGYIVYFFLVLFIYGFPSGFTSGLFPCLLISLSILYFGTKVIKNIR